MLKIFKDFYNCMKSKMKRNSSHNKGAHLNLGILELFFKF